MPELAAQVSQPSSTSLGMNTDISGLSSKESFFTKMEKAMRWGFYDLGLSVCKYIFYGIFLATIVFVAIPHWFVAEYLGNPSILSYGGSVTLGAVIYVCSIGHIPVVAALIAMGANPGVAMTFLLSGVATNLPELISISRLLKTRVALIYSGGLIGVSVMVGFLVNSFLTDFKPVLAVDDSNTVIGIAKSINVVVPEIVSQASAFFILVLGLWATSISLYNWAKRIPHEAA